MADVLYDRRDLDFVLYEVLGIERLVEAEIYSDHSRETFDLALDTAGQLAQDVFWPAYREFEASPAVFDGSRTVAPPAMHAIWSAAKEGGWFATSALYEEGGQQFPLVVHLATIYMFNAANTAAAMYIGQATGAAHLIKSYGDDRLRRLFLRNLFAGEYAGTMALTEPHAGTSLGDITASATKAPEGDYYFIRGTKRFISSGDHDLAENIVHPTLARIGGAPPGVKGISLFIIPKYWVNDDGTRGEFNDVNTAGIEHKLGLKGQATATLNFGENGTCKGWLLGEPNRGLEYMFQLMNQARIHTGVQAIAQAANAYQRAVAYARERVQGRRVTERDPAAPQIPIVEHAEVRRLLLTQRAYIEGVTALLLYAAYEADRHRIAANDEEAQRSRAILELLTPVCKAYASDVSFESISLAMQCFGGAGYIEEFPIAQLLRDNRVFAIYEGTNEVQAMDLLGRKVPMENGAYVRILMEEIDKTIAESGQFSELPGMTGAVSTAMGKVVEASAHLGGIGLSGDIETYISHASPYLRMFSQLVVAWMFLREAVVAQRALEGDPAEQEFYRAKLATARFYTDTMLPTTTLIADRILAGDRMVLDFDPAWF